ncbi:uncharacterized protein GGS22DRAFT_185331 [Annulohypoxylon maeteangense]|uniref:uncharacterized protein n=1 Tax=Annulohypoxylon maeteangense TaxID=1927788 RepID=UPI002007E4D3|nr:uncharacterized protein GGS22DRAFT_185331 [Annulohypoxylon maeteangense]KAI0887949.1 hypothetical protein GGS22DRAFT_185331 [Annulohypoxylon maeteangense]
MKLSTLRRRITPTGDEDTVPDLPDSCAILIPTSEGYVPIYASDHDICDQYKSTGHFCSLPAQFRDSWQHICPQSTTGIIDTETSLASNPALPTSTPLLDTLSTNLTLVPSPPPLSIPPEIAAGTGPPLYNPFQNASATAQHDAELLATGKLIGTSSWDTLMGLLFGLGTFIMVCIGIMLGCPCCPCGRRGRSKEHRPRPLTNAALLDNTGGIVYPGFGNDYVVPRRPNRS